MVELSIYVFIFIWLGYLLYKAEKSLANMYKKQSEIFPRIYAEQAKLISEQALKEKNQCLKAPPIHRFE